MPAKSAKQERFMQAVAHNPKFAAEAGVPQSVGKDFTKKRFAEGGELLRVKKAEDDALKPPPPAKERPYVPNNGLVPRTAAERSRNDAKRDALRQKQDEATYAKGGSIDGCAQRGKTRARRL